MGREIRQVPANWKHPQSPNGQYVPMFDQCHEVALAEYRACPEDWEHIPPQQDVYRPRWEDGEQTHFQIYDTVSEGTPASPVFESLDELQEWMVQPIDYSLHWNRTSWRDGRMPAWQCMQGKTREAAVAFCKSRWAVSMSIEGGVMRHNVDTLTQ